MSTPKVTGIGSQAKQKAFIERHEKFFATLHHILDAENAAFDRTLTATGILDPVIFYLGIRSVQDFNAITLLCANGDALPASALIRGMYERVVTAAYLEKNPTEVEAFAEYDYVQRYKVAKIITDAMKVTDEQKEQFAQLQKDYESVKPKFMVTDCEKCKTKTVGPSWTKLSFVAMAAKVPPLDALIVPAYYVPLSQAHSTLKSISSLLHGVKGELEFKKDYSAEADETFHLAYLLLMHVFKIQATHFKIAEIEKATNVVLGDYIDIHGKNDSGESGDV